jgi:N-methylhydantoinase A
VCFDDYSEAAIYQRTDLAPGDEIAGPAIIEEFGATVPLHPGFRARVDSYGNLVVTK